MEFDLGTLGLLQPMQRVERGMVLNRTGQHSGAARVGLAARPVQALERQVVRLGAAGREHHL